MFKYRVGEYLIDPQGEVIVIEDIDFDHHTRKTDYLIRIVYGAWHTTGMKAWIEKRVIESESRYRLLTENELVLYGDKNVSRD